MIVLNILIGIVLILFGRRLFWLFVGAIGFVFAMNLAVQAFPGPQGGISIIALIIGIVAGLIGALLAIFLQELAVGVAGFLAGGQIVLSLMGMLGLTDMSVLAWVLAAVGAVAGLILALALLDWALIILSSLSGAALIAESIVLSQPVIWVIFIAALVIGIIVQSRMLESEEV